MNIPAQQPAFINILIAEDNDVSRDMMAGILETAGYKIHHARDGGEAIDQLLKARIDMAFVDINMAPEGGFEFIKHLVVKGLNVPVVVVTGDDSTDILLEAQSLGVKQVMQKPVKPDMLMKVAERILIRQGLNPKPMAVEGYDNNFAPEAIMQKAIALAQNNVINQKGGPYGAIVADENGKILGEGVNGRRSRIDPTAHAEVMAIRQAAEKLGQTSLENCVLYCTSHPTKIGQALIESVGIPKVYVGAAHSDLETIKPMAKSTAPEYEQICKDEAITMLREATKH